jgi:hypothetical protein
MNPRASPSRRAAEGTPALSREALELLTPRAPLGVPVPAYGGRSLPNVASSIVRAVGGEPSPAALPALERAVDPFAGRRADGPVLLFVVDGLGYTLLHDWAHRPGAGALRAWLRRTAPITSVFPTTTTVALASLSTATSPSRHGLVGYRQFLPAFGAVVDMLRMSPLGVAAPDALLGPSWAPSVVLGAPTIFRGSVRGAVAVSHDRFEGSGFTRLLYDGADYEGYAAWSDLAGVLVQVLGRTPPPPLVVAYWDELDTVAHLRGPASPALGLEIGRMATLLEFVARELGPSAARATTVLLTADHGLVPVEPTLQAALESIPEVANRLARPASGDRRAGLLSARRGQLAPLREALARALPSGTTFLDADEAARRGLFGPPPFHPELAERIGELVVLPPSPAGVTYRLPGRSPARRHLVGAHGGLEAAELLVPLISGPLSELGAPPPERDNA